MLSCTHLSDPYPPWRKPVVAVCVVVLIFLYYWALFSDGKFLAVKPVLHGLMFNSMIEHLSHGRFDVDPESILIEGFERDGRTYAYFGVVPALLRAPILLFPRLLTVDFTVISCAIAATLTATANLAATLVAGRTIRGAGYKRRLLLFAMTAVIFGGSQVQFSYPSIFQEAISWASAIAALFLLMVFRWCVEPAGRRSSHLATMALLAGLCLLTRVSTSIGVYAACGGIMLTELIAAIRLRDGGLPARLVRVVSHSILTPSLILIAFAAICGYINFERWGSPVTFQDYRYYNSTPPDDPVFVVLNNYGYFNFRRIPFALSYFFFPIWTIIRPDGHFLFRELQDRLFYIVELPPATFFASDLFLCFLAVLGCLFLSRRRPFGIDRAAAWMVAIGFTIPGLFMLMAIAVTFRYRMEFYPFLEFVALFGLIHLSKKFTAHPRSLTAVCGAMIVVSVVSAHVFMVAYKISPWGDSIRIETAGWGTGYHEFFNFKYPGIDHYLMAH